MSPSHLSTPSLNLILTDLKLASLKTLTTHHLTVSSSSLLCFLFATNDIDDPLQLFEFDDLQHRRPSSSSMMTSLPFCHITFVMPFFFKFWVFSCHFSIVAFFLNCNRLQGFVIDYKGLHQVSNHSVCLRFVILAIVIDYMSVVIDYQCPMICGIRIFTIVIDYIIDYNCLVWVSFFSDALW